MNWVRLIWRWACSPSVRRAMEDFRYARRLLRAQQDLVENEGIQSVATALNELRRLWRSGAKRVALDRARWELKSVVARWLTDPAQFWPRERGEMLLIAFTVVLALHTFFVRPMKIPTGSMQPTLCGVRTEDLRRHPEVAVPAGVSALIERWWQGRRYYHIVCKNEGKLNRVEPVEPIWPVLKGWTWFGKQRFQVGEVWYTVWFPPTDLPNPGNAPQEFAFFLLAGLQADRVYKPGDDLIRMVVASGDQVLVDRLSYNFRRPARGEIIVFQTSGIAALGPPTHYIKRLVATGNDRVRIRNDRHLEVNGERLDADTAHYESVYSFSGPPAENRYSGHVNDLVARLHGCPPGTLAPLFKSERTEYLVKPKHLLVLGDNTMNSYDGRRFGAFPEERTVGKFWMVYWPLGERFGWGQN